MQLPLVPALAIKVKQNIRMKSFSDLNITLWPIMLAASICFSVNFSTLKEPLPWSYFKK
jgi:hypothetical protein